MFTSLLRYNYNNNELHCWYVCLHEDPLTAHLQYLFQNNRIMKAETTKSIGNVEKLTAEHDFLLIGGSSVTIAFPISFIKPE